MQTQKSLSTCFTFMPVNLRKQQMRQHIDYSKTNHEKPTNGMTLAGIRAPEKNNSTSCLSYGPSTALHPPTRISICAA